MILHLIGKQGKEVVDILNWFYNENKHLQGERSATIETTDTKIGLQSESGDFDDSLIVKTTVGGKFENQHIISKNGDVLYL